ncbi:MAG: hypothetical protein OHK0046_21760 [Anaerolineae bacterium]
MTAYRSVFLPLLLILLLLLAACDRSAEPLPTPIQSLDALATANFMTANAPPPGFREAVSFPMVDANLTALPSWRYVATMSFDGVFARTSRPVTAETRIQVWFNAAGLERRVIVEGSGDLFGQQAGVTVEGVRLGGDAYLVRENTCQRDADGAAALVADLRAGSLVGGVAQAVPNGINATINGERVWFYAFSVNDLVLPQIELAQDGQVTEVSAELWIAPERRAVIRYYATMQVENALILLDNSDSRLPVTGTLLIRYDLYDIGTDPNITQPFGC